LINLEKDTLDLAWNRVAEDYARRNFASFAYEQDLIKGNKEEWLSDLCNRLETNSYHPEGMVVCDVPKAGHAIRPGCYLRPDDKLLFASIVQICLPNILKEVEWARKKIDFSYPLQVNGTDWFSNIFRSWKDFSAISTKKLERNVSHVVTADICGYYDNVDTKLLASDLREIGCDQRVVEVLSKLLNRWNGGRRGIPQGHSAADVLGKLYLNKVDRALNRAGINHIRYVDDFRLFCSSQREAKKAIVELTRQLRLRGLNLQTEKLGLLHLDDAKLKFESVVTNIKRIKARFEEEVALIFDLDISDDYFEVLKKTKELPEDEDSTPKDVIKEAFRSYFIETAHEFDKSLFHYLLRKLTEFEDRIAVQKCKDLLYSHPEETGAILPYLHIILEEHEFIDLFAGFLRSPDSVYEFQKYQILRWIVEKDITPNAEILRIVRGYACDRGAEWFLRTISRRMLSSHGDSGDLDKLLNSYDEMSDKWERAEIICCIKRMEKGRRNEFLGRVESDGMLNSFSARFAKG
jgi:hypothetical protein